MNYREYNDFELIDYVHDNNEEARDILFKKYEPLINNLARKLYKTSDNCGIDTNDLIQEGMLGLSNAINNFSDQKDTSFYTYAKTCIENNMISFIIGSRRLKHKALNESLSLEQTSDNSDTTLEFLLGDDLLNPEVVLLNLENENELRNISNDILTDFEKQVFELKMNGFEYREIADILDRDIKSIDNALQRIRVKIKNSLQSK